MSWWLVRIYLCTALCYFIFPMSQTRVSHKYKIFPKTVNIPTIGRNIENSAQAQTSSGDAKTHGFSVEKQKKRSLAAGDTFTPSHMLPIAEKLFNKVENPGEGHGFVSSTNSPLELADKLFEAFFSTTKRIVFLNDEDIPGIDALQALALSGENVDTQFESVVTNAADTTYLRNKLKRMKPKRSKYYLVTKIAFDSKQTSSRKPNRRRDKLSKNLNKKRHLIINKRRDNRFKPVELKVIRKTPEPMAPSIDKKENPGLTKNQTCRWKYECSDMLDLDTCRIHSVCAKDVSNKSLDEIISIKHNSNEDTLIMQRFRKMLRIYTVDEEVEKILESRNLQFRPPNASKNKALEKVERLSEHFNKIILDDKYFSRATKSLSSENHAL